MVGHPHVGLLTDEHGSVTSPPQLLFQNVQNFPKFQNLSELRNERCSILVRRVEALPFLGVHKP